MMRNTEQINNLFFSIWESPPLHHDGSGQEFSRTTSSVASRGREKHLATAIHHRGVVSKRLLITLCCFLFLTSWPGPVEARNIGFTEDPLKIGIGARPMGMGGTYAALSDDSYAFLNNPAGLAGLEGYHFSSMYTNLLGDVNYLVVGGSVPFSLLGTHGSLAVGQVGSNVSNIITPSQTGFSYFSYHNNVTMAAYGFKSAFWGRPLDVGVNAKYFDEGFTGSIDYLGTGMDLDIGVRGKVGERTQAGLLVRNILPTSAGGRIRWANGDEESIPASLKVGLATHHFLPNVTLAMDYDMQLERSYPGYGHVGLEWHLDPKLDLRAGIDQGLEAGAVSSNLTAGVGLNLGAVSFNYAYHPYFGDTGALSHYFSLSLQQKVRQTLPTDTAVAAVEPATIPVEEPVAPIDKSPIVPQPVTVAVTPQPPLETPSQADATTRAQATPPITTPAPHSLSKISPPQPVFTDVDPTLWAYNDIKQLRALRIANGYPDGNFYPEKITSRAEMITLLTRVASLYDPTLNVRKRHRKEHWYIPYVETAEAIGMVTYNGYQEPATWGYSFQLLRTLDTMVLHQNRLDLAPFTGVNVRQPINRAEASALINRSGILPTNTR